MHKYLFMLLLLSPVSLYAMGEKPENAKPEKLIIESEELCDPEEQTEMPRFY